MRLPCFVASLVVLGTVGCTERAPRPAPDTISASAAQAQGFDALPCASPDSLHSDSQSEGRLWFTDAMYGASGVTGGGTMLSVFRENGRWMAVIEPVAPYHAGEHSPLDSLWPRKREPLRWRIAGFEGSQARLQLLPDSAALAIESTRTPLPPAPDSVRIAVTCEGALLLTWSGSPPRADTVEMARAKSRGGP